MNLRFSGSMMALLLLAATAHGLETSSYRIQALGGDAVAGIIADEFTDIHLNPARVGKVSAATLYGKVGVNADPLGLYYFAPGWAVEGEGFVNRTNDVLTDFDAAAYTHTRSQLRYATHGQTAGDDRLELAVLKAFPVRDGWFGVSLAPSFSSSRLRRMMENNIDVVSTQVLETRSQVRDEDSFNQMLGGEVKLGFHSSGGGREQDIVLSARYDDYDSTIKYTTGESWDRDPDGNGESSGGMAIPTPNVESWTMRKTSAGDAVSQTYRLERRVRARLDAGTSSTFGMGFAYAPGRFDETQTLFTDYQDVAGPAISSGTVTTERKVEVVENTYSAWAGYGRSIALRSDLTLGWGVRLSAAYDTIEQTADAMSADPSLEKGEATSLTLSAGAGIEYTPLASLAVRFGVAPSIATKVSSGDVITRQTDGKVFENDGVTIQQVDYTFGVGVRPLECLGVDLVTAGNITTPDTYRMQVTWLFR